MIKFLIIGTFIAFGLLWLFEILIAAYKYSKDKFNGNWIFNVVTALLMQAYVQSFTHSTIFGILGFSAIYFAGLEIKEMRNKAMIRSAVANAPDQELQPTVQSFQVKL